MRNNNNSYFFCRLLPLICGAGLCLDAGLLLPACHSPAAAADAGPVHHLVTISRPGQAFYIDRVSNRSVMKEIPVTKQEDTERVSSDFCSFLVGWQDSVVSADDKLAVAKEKYFQYDMQKDWVALVKGDSVYPVYFQEKPDLDKQRREGVMVFETPHGSAPDTLVYKDRFGSLGTQIFVLNRK